MKVVQLCSSTFWGGPERQLLGLCQALRAQCEFQLISFRERGRCSAFLSRMHQEGFSAAALREDTPHLYAAYRELAAVLRAHTPDVLCCHGYKADMLGLLAARRCRVPVVSVSRGWTGESLKVRLYDALDRFVLRGMDAVVCVAHAQAEKVLAAGVARRRISVIQNAVDLGRFDGKPALARDHLCSFFPRPLKRFVCAAGRFSPEKGFPVLLEAARQFLASDPEAGLLVFGDGPQRGLLSALITQNGLQERVVLPGHRLDLDRLLPLMDLLVVPSFTEGLPNIALEAMAASLPIVATAVGGNPEVVEDGITGFLVPPGDSAALAQAVMRLLSSATIRQWMGQAGRERVRHEFSFTAQGQRYLELFERLCGEGRSPSVVDRRERSRAKSTALSTQR